MFRIGALSIVRLLPLGCFKMPGAVDAACHRLAAFRDAAPAAQPDAG